MEPRSTSTNLALCTIRRADGVIMGLRPGLDSTTAMNLVTSLCQLAAGGRAVITTIHQPSSRLYQQLDKLLLLSDGHCMYYGAPGNCRC